MTVKQLIENLQEFPEDMPVATCFAINPEDIDNPNFIEVNVCTWEPTIILTINQVLII